MQIIQRNTEHRHDKNCRGCGIRLRIGNVCKTCLSWSRIFYNVEAARRELREAGR